ncbi:MAG TPA: hypothetical protein VK034_00890, partial [Enhygromyxa sp.]|nr:hypothetical protein [Enhygromyxa sp.]
QLTSLSIQVGVVDVAATDQVELIIDPGDQEHHELLAITGDSIATEVTLPAALTAGPHHLRARIVDRDGQPHPNPSASAEVVVFVRDQVIPDTPQIAVVWPPDGYRHRVGNPLEVEVAVLAGSFTFVERSDQECKPLADCEPAFGLECEDQCGPVSREGHARIYMLPEYPGCLLGWPDLPIGCNGDYASSLRPGSGGELLDEHRVRGVIRENLLSKPGMIPLHAGLSYSYHDSYPSDADVIHESITIEVID